MRCPERSPLYVRKGSRCSSTCGPRGDPVPGISSAATENPTQTSFSWGEPGDVRGKSSLQWIAIIGVVTTAVTVLSPKMSERREV